MLFVVSFSTSSYAGNSKYAALVIDANTGQVLHQDYAGALRHPASLTKMMTLYLTFRAIKHGRLAMDTPLKVSKRAARQPRSKLGLNAGDYIKVEDAIQSLVVLSANDIAVVLAEAIGGTEWKFANMMTTMAKRLGMTKTNFKNASGLHHPKQVTTAYDLARLAVALRRDYPEYYHYFARAKFVYRGNTYSSHNNVTKRYQGADGLKTGYINASGFNLVTSAERSGARLVGVVLGGRTSKRRDRQMVRLLDQYFYKIIQAKKNNTYGVATIPETKLKPDYVVTASARGRLSATGIGSGDVGNLPLPDIKKHSLSLPKPVLKP